MGSVRFWMRCWFQHTAARRRLANRITENTSISMFQHTAARRRLVPDVDVYHDFAPVSTHSRPKAAGFGDKLNDTSISVSTHSRPKAAGSSLLQNYFNT